MSNEWPTKTEDLEVATDIINKHVERNEGDPLGFIEVVVDRRNKEKPVQVRMPDWVRELMIHFRERYGADEGQLVATKVLTKVLLRNETIH